LINTMKAKAAMVAAGYTQTSLAPEMNMSVNTINSKINGKTPFDVDEAVRFCDICNVDSPTERAEIFLP